MQLMTVLHAESYLHFSTNDFAAHIFHFVQAVCLEAIYNKKKYIHSKIDMMS